MPPKKRRANSKTAKSKTAKLPSVSCCVCCRPVNISKDEVLFCTGTCQEWIHRCCVSVTVKAYQSIKDAGSPFLCFCCQQIRSRDEVTKLNDEVRQLKKEVTELKTELSTLRPQASPCPQTELGRNATNAIDTTDSVSTRKNSAAATSYISESPSHSIFFHDSGVQARSTKLVPNLNKKFNIVDVIYGIDEYPKDTTRSKRLDSDLSKVFSVVRAINSKIHSQGLHAFA